MGLIGLVLNVAIGGRNFIENVPQQKFIIYLAQVAALKRSALGV